jgi:hypothetical protein
MKHAITYFLTLRLIEDSLESLFSQIRNHGGLHGLPSFSVAEPG